MALLRLPLGFEAAADATSDPLVQLLLQEEEDEEADALESLNTSQRESVLVRNTIEEHGDTLNCRKGDTAPGPCLIIFSIFRR